MADPGLGEHWSTTARRLFSTSFTLSDLTRVRREVQAVSRRCGLDEDHVEDWITAVNELMINAVRHGGGRGTVRLLFQSHRIVCEVTDCGPGFDTTQYVPRTQQPPLTGNGGMGLWLVGQMAEFLLIDSGPVGTTVRIGVPL